MLAEANNNEPPSIRDVKHLHLALSNVWRISMTKEQTFSKQISIVNPNQDDESVTNEEYTIGFKVDSRDHVKSLIVKFFDLIENRKFSTINNRRASLEKRIKVFQSTEVSDPKINARSEKIVAGKEGSVPRLTSIIDKGREYQRRKSVKQEEKLLDEASQCTFKPKINSVQGNRHQSGSNVIAEGSIHTVLYN